VQVIFLPLQAIFLRVQAIFLPVQAVPLRGGGGSRRASGGDLRLSAEARAHRIQTIRDCLETGDIRVSSEEGGLARTIRVAEYSYVAAKFSDRDGSFGPGAANVGSLAANFCQLEADIRCIGTDLSSVVAVNFRLAAPRSALRVRGLLNDGPHFSDHGVPVAVDEEVVAGEGDEVGGGGDVLAHASMSSFGTSSSPSPQKRVVGLSMRTP
jgi:hypothetical protein